MGPIHAAPPSYAREGGGGGGGEEDEGEKYGEWLRGRVGIDY